MIHGSWLSWFDSSWEVCSPTLSSLGKLSTFGDSHRGENYTFETSQKQFEILLREAGYQRGFGGMNEGQL